MTRHLPRAFYTLPVASIVIAACGGHVAGELPDEECPTFRTQVACPWDGGTWCRCPSYNCYCENTYRIPFTAREPIAGGGKTCGDPAEMCRALCRSFASSSVADLQCLHSVAEFDGPYVVTAKQGERCSVRNDGKGTPRMCDPYWIEAECCGKPIKQTTSLGHGTACPASEVCPTREELIAEECRLRFPNDGKSCAPLPGR